MILPGSLSERDLIPYSASVFDPGTILVLAPHPDDEVFGCGAALAQLNRDGAKVHVLLLSDGAAAGESESERSRIAAIRIAESRAALGFLGGGEVESAGLPDRGLWDRMEDLHTSLTRTLVRLAPKLIFVPSPAEVHPDHRAVAQAFLEVVNGGMTPGLDPTSTKVAFYEVSQPIRPNFLLDASPFMDAKEKAVLAFVSQNGGHDYPAFVRGLMSYRRMTLPQTVTAAEGFFVLSLEELLRRRVEELVRILGPSLWHASPGGGLL